MLLAVTREGGLMVAVEPLVVVAKFLDCLTLVVEEAATLLLVVELAGRTLPS